MNSLDSRNLKNALEYTITASATTDKRPVLHGVLFDFDGDHLFLVGCDGYRLHRVDLGFVSVEKPKSFILGRKDAKELKSWIKLSGSDVTLTVADHEIIFSQFYKGDKEKRFLPVSGNYPDWRSIVPNAYNTRSKLWFMLSEEQINDYADLFSVLWSWDVDVKSKRLTLSSTHKISVVALLDVQAHGDSQKFCVCGDYVYDAWLNEYGKYYVFGAGSPIVMEHANNLAVIMTAVQKTERDNVKHVQRELNHTMLSDEDKAKLNLLLESASSSGSLYVLAALQINGVLND